MASSDSASGQDVEQTVGKKGFRLFKTDKQIVEKEYICSTDPRGTIPVYEFSIGDNASNKLLVDRTTWLVLFTSILKAVGHTKLDVVKLIEGQPEIAPVMKKIRGGVNNIQGTWLPIDIAKKLALRIAWPIRCDLIPIFGPSFPSKCLPPYSPDYGNLILSDPEKPRRRTRNSEPRTKAKSTPPAAEKSLKIPAVSESKSIQESASASVSTSESESPSKSGTRLATPATPATTACQEVSTSPPPEKTVRFAEDVQQIVQEESQVGPFKHQWQGYQAPLRPPQNPSSYTHQHQRARPEPYSSLRESRFPFQPAYDPRHLQTQSSLASYRHHQAFVPPDAPYCYPPPPIPGPYTYRSFEYHPYPPAYQAQRGIRLPPRSSFASHAPSSPFPVTSLRSTLEDSYRPTRAHQRRRSASPMKRG